jgi:hypothetical protein
VREVEQQMLQVAGIRSVNTQTTLPGGRRPRGSGQMPPTIASAPCSSTCCRSRTQPQRLRRHTRDPRTHPGHRRGRVEVQAMEQGPPVGKPIQIELRSRYRELLEPAMARIRALHRYAAGAQVDIDDTPRPALDRVAHAGRPRPGGPLWRRRARRRRRPAAGHERREDRRVPTPSGADDAVDIRARFPAEARGYRGHGRAAHQHPAGAHTPEQFRGDCARTGRGHLRAHRRHGRRASAGRGGGWRARRHHGAAHRAVDRQRGFRPACRHSLPRCQRGAGRVHGLRAGRVSPVPAADVRAAGHAVQQLLPERSDPPRRGDVDGRRAARPAGHR